MTAIQTHTYDVAIIGAGPAGLQAALLLARTRKQIIVFDAPQPPRNAASHGVHNFVGLDGLLPGQIREQAWQQIQVYNSAELHIEQIVDVQLTVPDLFTLQGENGSTVQAHQVILAVGYQDVYPEIAGFRECWGQTIIPCPFCDGYENRDRVWGIAATSEMALEHLPTLARNWTARVKVFLASHLTLNPQQLETLTAHNIDLHYGDICAIQHSSGSVEAVTLHTGEQVQVETLIWRPQEAPTALTRHMINHLKLELDANGYIKTDEAYQTTLKGLWAVGDVKGWAGALGAAFAANRAATSIVRGWYL